nr:hypothetical protein [Escherichia coli]
MSKTTPTKDSIRAEFEELVEKDSFWSKFVGSQFVSMLTLLLLRLSTGAFSMPMRRWLKALYRPRRGVPLSWQRQKRIVTLVPSQHRHRG